jgi:nucleotide-binding universal stress UspA family protein
VLLCVDGSADAQQAAVALAGLPWIGDCQVTVLGARGAHQETAPGVAEAAALFPGAEVLDRQLTGVVAPSLTFDARAVILQAVAELGPDLVAMGTRGLGGMRRMLLGSTASALVRHAPCSVLVVRAAESA